MLENVTIFNVHCSLYKVLEEDELSSLHNGMLDLQVDLRKVAEIPGSRFFHGDWKSLLGVIPRESYDLLLTSETIYCPENYADLLNLFDHCLKRTSNSKVYIFPFIFRFLAAKRFYFGLQGSVMAFKLAAEQDGRFTCSTIWKMEKGVAREICCLLRK